MPRRSRDEHLFGEGPKRILALDGGGIRGMLTLSYLKLLEEQLRERHQNADLLLSDYYDLIGGTSTGAIIAAGLAKGYAVETLQDLYRDFGRDIFRKKWWRKGLVFAKFRAGPLRRYLDEHFDFELGDSRLTTGLMIMTKRWDTGSPWVIHNNPRGKYFSSGSSSREPNSKYNLAQVVRASTAAPTFFRPEKLRIARGVEGRFVDGGVTPHNNPALQLLLMATLEGFRLNWELGADRILLTSVGTGMDNPNLNPSTIKTKLALYDGITSLSALRADCDWLDQTLLQWLSESRTPWKIDSEVGDLSADLLTGQPLVTYQRYNVWFDRKWLKEDLGIDITEAEERSLPDMANPRNLAPLEEIGNKAAAQQIEPQDFPRGFDLPERQRP
ncbi:MAG: patatin [bacterium]|nr:patatin [bacterium]